MSATPPPPPPAAAAVTRAAKPDVADATVAGSERPHLPPPALAADATTAAAPGVDTKVDDKGLPAHLVVLAHGLSGTPEDLTYLKQSLEREGGSEILVHSARRNEGKTKDGVVEGGSRLAEEILEVVQSTPSLSRISLVGNSLGGLYVRYAAKLLYRDETTGGDGGTGATVAGLSPSVFMTIATPHLGVRRFTYVPLPSPLHSLAGVFVGKTGHDLFLSRKKGGSGGGGGEAGGEAAATAPAAAAKDGRENSLLYNMATTKDFLRPLKAFRWRRAYANRRGDFMVPYGTAAFVEPDEGDGSDASPSGRDGAKTGEEEEEEQDVSESDAVVSRGVSSPPDGAAAALADGTESFTFADRLLGAKNAAIVGVSRVSAAGAAAAAAAARTDSDSGVGDRAGAAKKEEALTRKSMEEEMAAGLNSCGWEKVSVDFGGVAPFSHNKICALSRTAITTALYGSGRSVVDHAAAFLVKRDRETNDDDDDDRGNPS
ncbi:putative serine esterase [Ectocarpus siliculosus]|uniref:Serine esterase n=1 Tax=Ectocarpus siliculosus TaxID=2880 RepID=D7G287_ECTSI|nr:putative serine esterase [Ectocarpus siliculosus]|eukprot:CBJ48764.1 putative serine esterase [Ectocarpus siliculosus]